MDNKTSWIKSLLRRCGSVASSLSSRLIRRFGNFFSSKMSVLFEKMKKKMEKSKKRQVSCKKILGSRPDPGVLFYRRIVIVSFFTVTSIIGFILGFLPADNIQFTGAFSVSAATWLVTVFMPTAWKNRNTEYTVIEFLGIFYKIKGPGLHFRIPYFEQNISDPYKELGKDQTVDIRYKEIKLYESEKDEDGKTDIGKRKNLVDFKDISVPVDIRVYGRIGKENAFKEQLFDSIYRWMYVMEDSLSRVKETADSFFRPVLENETTEEAKLKRGSDLWDSEGVEAKEKRKTNKAFAQVGFFLNPTKKILLSDIILPSEADEARLKAYLAKQEGIGRYSGVIEGLIRPVAVLMQPVEKGGLGIKDPESALDRYFQNRGLDVAKDIENLTVFLNRGDDITKVLDVSGSSQKSNIPINKDNTK